MPLAPIKAKLFRRLLEVGSDDNIRKSLEKLHPADIAPFFSELAPGDRSRLLKILFSMKKAAKVLREMPEFFLSEILSEIDDKQVATTLVNLEPDDALYFLESLSSERQETVLTLVPISTRNLLEQMILYPEDSAGSIMNVSIVTLKEDMTAQDAIDHIRANKEHMGVYYLYVVDSDGILSGILSLRDLLLAKADTNINELMNRQIVTVEPTVDREEVAQLFSQYNLLGMPVVDENRKLLGVITVDDVIDIIEEEATEDIYYMAGLSEADRAFSPLKESVRRRLPWITLNIGTACLSALVVGFFQKSIVQAVALAVFMPVVVQVAGSVGIQTLTVITRSIALGELEFATAGRAIGKEMGSGLIIGLIAGLIVGGVGYLWMGNMYLGIVLASAMVLTMVLAGTIGALIPLTLRAMGFDPALGSGVAVIAITDVCGFVIFLGLGTMFLSYLGI